MATWELTGYSTEERGENAVRHREYTTSKKTAELFDRIPRIQFTDSGHGIEFMAGTHTGPRRPVKVGLREHVQHHMKLLREASDR